MTIVTPDAHGVAVVLLIVAALYLFTRDRVPLESTSLAVIIVLIVGFHVFPYEIDGAPLDPAQFFMGFGNEALITICSLIIIGKTLKTTGALQPLARLAGNLWFKRPSLALLMMLVSVFLLSACMNDTPIVVLMIPVLVGIASRTNLPASRFLLPMGLSTIIGGMCTTIGTSTNLLVVGIARDLGVADIGMFDFTLPAVLVGAVGLLFVWLIVPRLLPDRVRPITDARPRIFAAHLTIREDGFAAGKTLKEVLAKTDGDMRVEQIQRGDTLIVMKLPLVALQPGDRLLVKDTPENLKRFEVLIGASLFDASGSEHAVDSDALQKARDQQVAQIVVTRDSPFYGRSVPDIPFSASFGLIPLAVHRAMEPSVKEVSNLNQIRLAEGDVVLVQGRQAALDAIKTSSRILVLDDTTDLPKPHRAKRSLVVLAMVIGFAALGLMPISITAIIGVGLMIALGCLSWRDVGRSLPVAVIMLIVASLALGKALVTTGMAEYLAGVFVATAGNLPPAAVLSSFILIMAVLTNIVSNNAAAVIGTPIAISAAQQIGVDPLPFVLAVLFGANMSFATPFGYQTNLLILSAGGYQFSDFLKAGIPLILILWLGFSIVLPLLYGV